MISIPNLSSPVPRSNHEALRLPSSHQIPNLLPLPPFADRNRLDCMSPIKILDGSIPIHLRFGTLRFMDMLGYCRQVARRESRSETRIGDQGRGGVRAMGGKGKSGVSAGCRGRRIEAASLGFAGNVVFAVRTLGPRSLFALGFHS